MAEIDISPHVAFNARATKGVRVATAIEYGLIAALIAVGIIVAIDTLGPPIAHAFGLN